MSKVYQRTPAEILSVHDELAAYYLNRAVAIFGTRVDADIEEATKDKKTEAQREASAAIALARWVEGTDVASKFRTPTATM